MKKYSKMKLESGMNPLILYNGVLPMLQIFENSRERDEKDAEAQIFKEEVYKRFNNYEKLLVMAQELYSNASYEVRQTFKDDLEKLLK